MTGARQAAPQNFGTLRLYADPGVRDAPTWRRGRPPNYLPLAFVNVRWHAEISPFYCHF
jgi:hypothetical protein